MTSKVSFWTGIVVEILLIAAVSVTSICMRQFLTPFHRGFFKDDESLMHPYKESSVTNVMLYTIGFIVPTFSIILVEFIYVKLSSSKQRAGYIEDNLSWRTSIWKMFSILIPFYFGAATTHALTNVIKYSTGRLRPHFFTVCQPDFSLLNDTSGYIEKDICAGLDLDLIKESRLSFPSGHSSVAMYCSVYFILYLYHRFTWKRVTLICPICQLVIFGAGLYTSLSRISDYKHHWSDVLGGGLLGVIIAVLSIIRVLPIFETKRHPLKRKRRYNVESGPRLRSLSENGDHGGVTMTVL